jgi:hypothetical protein
MKNKCLIGYSLYFVLATVNTKIMISETGFKLPRGKGVIQFGDVLKSSMTHDVVVMLHKEQKKPIVKVIDKDIWFELEEFINSWGSHLEISHNVNYYGG